MKKLSSELSTCHDIIFNLRNENASLIAKVDSNVCDNSISILRDDNVNLLAELKNWMIHLLALEMIMKN